ncbi:FG-GAP repeat protein [Thiolapillus sp.]|uniref:FG-GAP repeat protein n=1 Tax=Thiolapillus sp. TaxID=2017437 RepID=UPI003AF718AA
MSQQERNSIISAISQDNKLVATDGAIGDGFGRSVSISGDWAVVGAYADSDNGGQSGSAYLFYRNSGGAGNWGQVKKLLPADGAAADYFGESVAISGDTIIVGAWLDDDNGSASGSAYIFSRNQGGTDNWGQVKKLLPSDGSSDDRCQPWRAKRRLVDPSSREAALFSRRALRQRENKVGLRTRRPVIGSQVRSSNELAKLLRSAW